MTARSAPRNLRLKGGTLEKSRVLIVDDNAATVTLLTAMLRREYAVEAASDGYAAIEKLRTNLYAAIILDLRMPLLDGFGVLDFIKEHSPDLLRRVVVLTASLTRNELTRVDTYPVCSVVPKPFEIETLLHAIKQCVDPDDARQMGGLISSGMIILLADLLRTRFL